MSETKMPAAEANSYELAFHVLPTVAEGEVPTVFDSLKAALTKAGAEITDEEAPERFDLAYEIIKYLEGRNRKFSSAYFGWVRFTAKPEQVEAVNEAIEGVSELLRHLLVKLNKVEEENPFRFHEALDVKQVENGEESEESEVKEDKLAEETAKEEEKVESKESADTEESGEEAK